MTVRTVSEILNKAGCNASAIVRAMAGRRERNLPGYQIKAGGAERRVVHVFHVGRGAKTALNAYAAALTQAGLIVVKERGGLRVSSARRIEDRRQK